MEKIHLTEEKETLLVPLYSKGIQVQGANPIINDVKAAEILCHIDYDFHKLQIPNQSLITLAIRAKRLDSYVVEYLANNRNPLVLHLGCGLDSRIVRVGNDKGQWYDLDYPDVIELRRKFYEETKHYHMIASSVTDYAWLDGVDGDGPACIIAEGLLMYLSQKDVKELVARLQSRFPGSEMAFDAYSEITARGAKNHPSIKKTGAVIHWGIDDAELVETWGAGTRLLEEWSFTNSEDISTFPFGPKLLFRIAGLFAAARKAHRILRVQL